MSREIQCELNALLAKAVDASLSPEEADRLERLVRGNPERLRYMRYYLQLEVQLEAEATVVDGVALESGLAANRSRIQKDPSKRRSILLYAAVFGGLAAAICFAMVRFDSVAPEDLPLQPTVTSLIAYRPPAPVATLTAQSGAEWKGHGWSVGHVFREGDSIELVSGDARISVGCGAEIAAKAPCTLAFLAHDRLQLEKGEVTVHVADWAKGFTVSTKSMEVVDLGTTFTVSASDGGKDETRVLEGLVRVHPRFVHADKQRGLLVSEGEALSVAPDGRHENQLVLPAHLAASCDFSAVIPYRPVELRNTGRGLEVGDEDPHWVVVAGPDGDFQRPEYAMVCVPDDRYMANVPELSQWVSLPSWRTAAANSTYTFQTRFDLTGYDLATTRLFGRFLADNGIKQVRVNGHEVEVKSWVDNVKGQEFGIDQFRFIDITEGLVHGENVVEIDVWNGTFKSWIPDRDTKPNPMALRVEWYAFGRQSDLAVSNSNRSSVARTLR